LRKLNPKYKRRIPSVTTIPTRTSRVNFIIFIFADWD